MCREPSYNSFAGGLPYLRDANGGLHLIYDMLQRADGIFVLNLASLLLLDYDTPSDRHIAADAVVGQGLQELMSKLESSGPVFEKYGFPAGATWRVHRTAGGYHAFRMDIPIPPTKEVADMLLEIVCDPGYASLVRNTETWPIRVSKKRENEGRVYEVVHEASGPSPICEECRLQMWLYEEMVKQYGN